MGKNLVKVEIGCGKTKTDGYIGVDRFPLKDVDIVADVNQGLPFENDTVDVIFACHSLEHMDELENIMSEIYRVSKNRSIIQVLAPYSKTTLNDANYYHKVVFNEDTFRFCTSYPTELIEFNEYYSPHSTVWGLEDSDNSEIKMQIEPLKMEFFYYKEYRHLTSEQKRYVRRTFNNVCDQIFYLLVVNKQNKPFTESELEESLEKAQDFEPPIINILRIRDTQELTDNLEVLEDISTNSVRRGINQISQNLVQIQQQLDICHELQLENTNLHKSIEELVDMSNKTKMQIQQQASAYKKLQLDNENLYKFMEKQINVNNNLSQKLNDLEINCDLRLTELTGLYSNKLGIVLKDNNIFFHVKNKNQEFLDQIILNLKNFNKKSVLNFSTLIPVDNYVEYTLNGFGEAINFYLQANYNSLLLIEIVYEGKISLQHIVQSSYNGSYQISGFGKIEGNVAIRFKSLNNMSITRVLEFSNTTFFIHRKPFLAAYIN